MNDSKLQPLHASWWVQYFGTNFPIEVQAILLELTQINMFPFRKQVDARVFARWQQKHYGCVQTASGTETRLFGMLHSEEDKPAVKCSDGTCKWYADGKPHRDGDKPAVVRTNGDKEWYYHGKRHRDGNMPAVINKHGKKWYQNNRLINYRSNPRVTGGNRLLFAAECKKEIQSWFAVDSKTPL